MNLSLGMALGGLLTLSVGTVAQADERLQPDFTFRSVSVPNGTGSRITAQIDPSAQSAIRPPDSYFDDGEEGEVATVSAPVITGGTVDVPTPSGYEWFWSSISPRMEDSGPGRLEAALLVLGDPPEGRTVATPRVQDLQDIASAYGTDILRATIDTGVSPALALAVISVESGGRPQAVSGAGAAGLMQLMPATAERFGVTDRDDPTANIAGGVAYLDWLLDHFDGDPILALAGYNAGEGAVRNNSGVPPYAETRGYVPKVLAAWSVARGLCQTPPVLISDGCVFAVNGI